MHVLIVNVISYLVFSNVITCLERDLHKQLQIKWKNNSFPLCVIKIECVPQINR